MLQQRVESQNRRIGELGLTAGQWLDTVLAHVQSGIDLNEPTFVEENITFCQLRNIDHNKNPQFYSKLSQHADDNHEPTHLDELDSQDEDEEEGKRRSPCLYQT